MPRRRATTADDVVTAAAALVAEHGPTGMHVSRLARACGVSVGTVYNHFPSKEHLLAAVARAVESDFVGAMNSAAPTGRALRPAVPALTAALLEVAARSPAARLLHDVSGSDSHRETGTLIRQWVRDRVTRAQADGEVGPADPVVVADLAFALVRAGLPHAATAVGAAAVQPLLAAGLTALLPSPDSSAATSRTAVRAG